MIDVVVVGPSAVSTSRDHCSDLGLAIHAIGRCMLHSIETQSMG